MAGGSGGRRDLHAQSPEGGRTRCGQVVEMPGSVGEDSSWRRSGGSWGEGGRWGPLPKQQLSGQADRAPMGEVKNLEAAFCLVVEFLPVIYSPWDQPEKLGSLPP